MMKVITPEFSKVFKVVIDETPRAPTLRLLGGFALDRPGEKGDGLSYNKGRAILTYLAQHGAAAQARKKLAGIFWPDLPGEAALDNLRQVLHKLRHVLNGTPPRHPCLIVARDTVSLDVSELHAFDIADFLRPPPVIQEGSPWQVASNLAHMARQVVLYRGEFLAGFSLPECPDFEDWLQAERESLAQHALDLLNRLADGHDKLEEWPLALAFSRRYLELAPWDEAGHRRTMRLHAALGDGSSALAQFNSCCRILRNELGIAPGAETSQLAARIRDGRFMAPAPNPATGPPASEEKREVTVLYCELSIGEVDDLDAAMNLLLPVRNRIVDKLRQFAGHVVDTGLGVALAYFGYPRSSEHAVHFALKAALAVIGEAHPGVELRIGIHCGPIISGGSLNVPDKLGITTTVASHLVQLLGNDEVAVSSDARYGLEAEFAWQQLGRQKLPGGSRPREVFRLLHENDATSPCTSCQ